MRDFSVDIYIYLLDSLKHSGYCFQTFGEFLKNPSEKTVILRHDVDKMPLNSLRFARIENEKVIQASYFFRTLPISFNAKVIQEIYSLNHEIGYHYEDLDKCNGEIEEAYISLRANLSKLRSIVPVETICMHGSPLSKYDNRDIWNKYDYTELGILGEPYLDLDYSKVFYITDTGRTWCNTDTSIRDKVDCGFQLRIKNTEHLIELAMKKMLPSQLMINTHPQRWSNNSFLWSSELILQNIKNVVKKVVVKTKQ